MKKFKFNLEKVLQHRKVVEDQARAEMMLAKSELNKQIEKLENLNTDRTGAFQRRYVTQVEGGVNLAELAELDLFIKGQDIRIEVQKKKVQEHEKLVEEKSEILRKAALEVKMIVRLKEKKQAEYKEEFLRTEQSEMDEQTVLRYGSRNKGA